MLVWGHCQLLHSGGEFEEFNIWFVLTRVIDSVPLTVGESCELRLDTFQREQEDINTKDSAMQLPRSLTQ